MIPPKISFIAPWEAPKTDFWKYLGFCPNQGRGGLPIPSFYQFFPKLDLLWNGTVHKCDENDEENIFLEKPGMQNKNIIFFSFRCPNVRGGGKGGNKTQVFSKIDLWASLRKPNKYYFLELIPKSVPLFWWKGVPSKSVICYTRKQVIPGSATILSPF